jgi:hypothetical protein
MINSFQAAESPYAKAIRKSFRLRKITQSKLPATRMSRFLQCSWMRGPRAEAPERTPKAEVRRSPYGAQDSKRKEFLHQQERRRRGLDLFGYFLGQAKKVTPGEGADSPFKNKHVTVFKIELRSLLNDKLLSSRRVLRPPMADLRDVCGEHSFFAALSRLCLE